MGHQEASVCPKLMNAPNLVTDRYRNGCLARLDEFAVSLVFQWVPVRVAVLKTAKIQTWLVAFGVKIDQSTLRMRSTEKPVQKVRKRQKKGPLRERTRKNSIEKDFTILNGQACNVSTSQFHATSTRLLAASKNATILSQTDCPKSAT